MHRNRFVALVVLSCSAIATYKFAPRDTVRVGSRANRPTELRPGVPIPFEKGRVVCATEMGSLTELPNALAIIGGGVIATEYATVFAEVLWAICVYAVT